MEIDAFLPDGLAAAAERAAAVEHQGFDGLWAGEIAHDPLLALAAATTSTARIALGTAITVAFARSPMTVAYQAWDLARASRGRFILGLGAQVRAHITRRFSMPWDKPVPQLRDYLGALAAIFDAFQSGVPLAYEGSHYRHTLLTPVFDPGPLPDGHRPQVALAAVGKALTSLAGELCDGVFFHPFTTTNYLDEVSSPALAAGAARVSRAELPWRFAYLMLIVGDDEPELAASQARVRKQLAFYGSTPAYREVLASIGYADLQPELQALSKQGRWDEMSALFDDDLLDHFALRGRLEDIPVQIADRYATRADRVASYFPLPDYDPDRIAAFVAETRSLGAARERIRSQSPTAVTR